MSRTLYNLSRIGVPLILFFGISLLTGCGQVVLHKSVANPAELHKKTLVVMDFKPTQFTSLTKGAVVVTGGIIGAFAAFSAGKELAEKYRLTDPASDMRRQLALEIVKRYKLKRKDIPHEPLTYVQAKKSATKFAEAQLALKVITVSWGITYTSDMNVFKTLYNVRYTGIAEITDLKTNEILAKSTCRYQPYKAFTNEKGGSKYEALLADDAKLLKSEIAKATEYCKNLYYRQLALGESPPANSY